MTDAIRTEKLTKVFQQKVAVDQLSWTVPSGSIVGLLGPNGAGKTTTLKMLLGMTHPTSGKGRVLGLDIETQSVDLRKSTAFVSEDKLLYDSLEVNQFLKVYAGFFPEWSGQAESELMGTWRIPRFETIKELSKGMRAKLLLAASILRKPQLLLLDEPTEGLDPESVEEILGLIARWCSSGDRTVVIATHRLDEVERICDRVSILDRGQLLVSGNLDDLKKEWKQIELSGDLSLLKVEEWEGIQQVKREGWSIQLIVNKNLQATLDRLAGYSNITCNVRDMNLREIYLACMKRKGGMDYGVLEDLA